MGYRFYALVNDDAYLEDGCLYFEGEPNLVLQKRDEDGNILAEKEITEADLEEVRNHYFALYKCDKNGDEIEHLSNFYDKRVAIQNCDNYKYAHVVIMPDGDNFDEGNSDDMREWNNSVPEYEPYEVIYESKGLKNNVPLRVGQKYIDGNGGTLTVDYVGPSAINYHFNGENKGANQSTPSQFEAVLDANGFTAIKSAFPGENPKDEYLKRMGRNMRENQATLTQGEFDDAMDNNGYFIRGFYKWGPDSHNWACEVDVNLYLVVSYSPDGGGVWVRLIDTSSGKKEMADERYIHFLNYNDVVQECLNIGESIGEDFTEFFENIKPINFIIKTSKYL